MSRRSSIRYASARCPVRVSAGSTSGVPRKPVAIRPSASGPAPRAPRPTASRSAAGAMPKLERDGAAGLRGQRVVAASGSRCARRPRRRGPRTSGPVAASPSERGGTGGEPGAVRRRTRWRGSPSRGLGLLRPVARGVGVEPVAELELARRAGRRRRRGPAGSATQRAHAAAAGARAPRRRRTHVHGPGHDRRGVRPAGPAERGLALADGCSGTTLGTPPSSAWSSARSTQPARPEGLGVEERAGGRRERLGVAGPAEPLVALRAVGGDGRRSCRAATSGRSRGTGSAPGREHANVPRGGVSLLMATHLGREHLGVGRRPRRTGSRGR